MNILSIVQNLVFKLCINIDTIEKTNMPQTPKFPRFELDKGVMKYNVQYLL